MAVFLLIVGLALLVGGAELLVRGASRLAAALGVSPLIIGLTVVAYGTGAPELAVGIAAVREGQGDVALGNIIGSNICNVLLILGISALILPLAVARQLIRFDVPIMIGVSILAFLAAVNGVIGRGEGLLLLAGMVVYTVFQVVLARREGKKIEDEFAKEFSAGDGRISRRWLVNLALIGAGFVLLVLGSRWLVAGAVSIAEALGVSQRVIGLTIVALGTSLPEVATSVVASVKGARDIAIGNVVGSNIFNLFGVLGATAFFSPDGISVPDAALAVDFPVMLACAVACLPVFFTGSVIARWEGGLFLGYYVAYTVYLIFAATDHGALAFYSIIMVGFVVPLTAITLAVLFARALRDRARGR